MNLSLRPSDQTANAQKFHAFPIAHKAPNLCRELGISCGYKITAEQKKSHVTSHKTRKLENENVSRNSERFCYKNENVFLELFFFNYGGFLFTDLGCRRVIQSKEWQSKAIDNSRAKCHIK